MPIIEIWHKLSDAEFEKVSDSLQIVTAAALSCPDRLLKPEHIMIKVTKIGPQDRTPKDIIVEVEAHDFPARVENHEAICRMIDDDVSGNLRLGSSWGVYVKLGPMAYRSDTER